MAKVDQPKKHGLFTSYGTIKKWVFLWIVALIAQQVMGLFFPMWLQSIAELIDPNNIEIGKIVRQGLVVGLVVIGFLITDTLCSWFNAKSTDQYVRNYRETIYRKVQKLPKSKIEELGVERIIPTITNDVAWLKHTTGRSIIMIVYMPVAFFGSLVLLFTLNPTYALFTLASLPFIAVFFIFTVKRLYRQMKISLPAYDRQHLEVKESMAGARELRLYNKMGERKKRFEDLLALSRKSNIKVDSSMHYNASLHTTIFTLITVAIIIYGSINATVYLDLIVLNTAIQYVTKIWGASQTFISYFLDAGPRGKMALARINQIMLADEEKEMYAGRKFDVINTDVNFKVGQFVFFAEEGKCTAVVGGTGIGKHAIVQHMIYERGLPNDDDFIKIGGCDTRTISRVFLRREVYAVCPQIPLILTESVLSNLTFLNDKATREEVESVCTDCGLNVKEGLLDVVVSETMDNITTEQRSLISIIRTILKPAKVYIFNQSFTDVSPKMVDKILDYLKKKKVTCIFVTHNLKVSRECHKIFVFNVNGTVANGTHAALLKSNYEYKQLNTALEIGEVVG